MTQFSNPLIRWNERFSMESYLFGEKPNKGNADLNYYYPTNDLVTGPDILFFWVARMIIAGYEYKDEKGDWFSWLYVDFETLRKVAIKQSFKAELLAQDEDEHFLCRLTLT